MWIQKIKRRKIQSIVIAFIMMIATATLIACVSFTFETDKFIDDYLNCNDAAISYDMVHDKDAVNYLSSNETLKNMISKVETTDVKIIKTDLFVNDEMLKTNSVLVHGMDGSTKLDINLPQDENGLLYKPQDNEVWVCRVFANSYNIKVGDTFKIRSTDSKPLVVSQIVDSRSCSSGFMDSYTCYCNSNTLQNVEGDSAYAVNIYAKDKNTSIKDLENALPDGYKKATTFTLSRNTLKMCLTILTTIFGSVGIMSAMIIFVVSIIVIRYIIRSSVDKEYKMIGIYKSIGKTEKEIRNIYLATYMTSGLLGIIPGVFLSRPLAKYLGGIVMGHISGYKLSYVTTLLSIGAAIFMSAVLLLNIIFELKKLKNITPVNAINSGVKSSKKTLCKSVIKNAHTSGAAAINDIFKHKRSSILVILVLTVSFYMCLMSGAVGLSLSHYADDKDIWENLPNYDGYIHIQSNEDVLSYLDNSDYIKTYVKTSLDDYHFDMDIENSTMTITESHPMAYSSFPDEVYKNVPLKKGRFCSNPHEITCSQKFLDSVNKQVGDYIKITTNEKQINYLITGSYCAMMKGGVSFYIQEADVKECVPDFKINTVLFFLKDGVSYNDFEKDFKSHFSNSLIKSEFPFIITEQDTVTDIAYPICIVLFISFMAFSILNIVNVLYTTNRDSRKKYATLKAMGFSNGYIYRQSIIKLSLECAVAIILTLIMHQFLSPVLFSLACGIKYIYKPAWLTALVCGSLYGIIILIATLMYLPLRKVSPVELMEE